MHHRHLFAILASGLLVVSGVLVLVVFLLLPPAPKTCTRIFHCGGPISGQAVRSGLLYRNSEFGFTVEYPSRNSGLQTAAQGILINFASNSQAEQGQVQIVGDSAHGLSAQDVVTGVQQQIAPSAVPQYAIPNPYIGYVPAVGEAYDVEQNGSSNSESLDRLLIVAAVHGSLAIAVIDDGPYWQFSNSNSTLMGLNDHPSPADQFAALFADPIVNSVGWPDTG